MPVGHLFVGRLTKRIHSKELEDVFSTYGKLSRCDIKYGAEMAYAFVDFDDKRDAEDALRYENGRELNGQRIVVEFTKSTRRESDRDRGRDRGYRRSKSRSPKRDRRQRRTSRSRSRGRSRSP